MYDFNQTSKRFQNYAKKIKLCLENLFQVRNSVFKSVKNPVLFFKKSVKSLDFLAFKNFVSSNSSNTHVRIPS